MNLRQERQERLYLEENKPWESTLECCNGRRKTSSFRDPSQQKAPGEPNHVLADAATAHLLREYCFFSSDRGTRQVYCLFLSHEVGGCVAGGGGRSSKLFRRQWPSKVIRCSGRCSVQSVLRLSRFPLFSPAEAELQAARSEHLSSLSRERKRERESARSPRGQQHTGFLASRSSRALELRKREVSMLPSQSCTPEPTEKQQRRVRHRLKTQLL